MCKKLIIEALVKFISGVLLVGLLIFIPAGTIHFVNGWKLMGVLFIPMFIAGVIMLKKAPDLLQSRLEAREKESAQKVVIALSGLMFLAGFISAGLDFRFGGPTLPSWIGLCSMIIFLISYGLFGEVMRENAYLSRTIQVQEGQTVVDTGMYAIVRHPMYLVSIFLFLSIPLILGSIWSFLIFLMHPFLMAARILHEEKILSLELNGYEEYKKKVRYRLIPFIW